MRRLLSALAGAGLGTMLTWGAGPALGDFVYNFIPVGRWLEVKSIQVGNTRVGMSPMVRVDRNINLPFTAHWTVTLRQVHPNGLEHVCARSGENDYRVSSILPPGTSLDWWMNVPVNLPCNPTQPGKYVVTMVWVVQMDGFPPKVARGKSNEFEVRT